MENQLRQLQLTQLEILKVIDGVCRENNINYSLYAGTLLGAVRHKGFIPWDDDLDICMSRRDYDRFIELWDKKAPAGYILQNKENAPDFSQSFTKIRKDHTTFLQEKEEPGKYHTGIFVDVFPIDRIPSGKLEQALFRWKCMRYQLFMREFVPPKSNLLVKLGSGLMLLCTPEKQRKILRKKLLGHITQFCEKKELATIAIETVGTLKTLYPADMLEAFTELTFEDSTFMCFADWHVNLTRKYGDYMQLPPEADRVWKHHPILIDFEHNYEELAEKQ